MSIILTPSSRIVLVPGTQGPPGPPGGAAFSQGFATQDGGLTVNHGLGRRPNVFVVDSNNDEFEVAVQHITTNQVVLTWVGERTGTVFCS